MSAPAITAITWSCSKAGNSRPSSTKRSITSQCEYKANVRLFGFAISDGHLNSTLNLRNERHRFNEGIEIRYRFSAAYYLGGNHNAANWRRNNIR
jgi:hypothetical protein